MHPVSAKLAPEAEMKAMVPSGAKDGETAALGAGAVEGPLSPLDKSFVDLMVPVQKAWVHVVVEDGCWAVRRRLERGAYRLFSGLPEEQHVCPATR